MSDVDIIRKAKINLLMKSPFFGTVFFNHNLVESDKIPTLAVDAKFNIYYNPDFVTKLNQEDKEYVVSGIAHEIAHTIMLTFVRGENKKKMGMDASGRMVSIWNLATDYANNLILKDCGFKIHKQWLCDEKYRGMPADAIYDSLCKEIEENGSLSISTEGMMVDIDLDDLSGNMTESDKSKMEKEVKMMVANAANISKRSNKWGDMPEAFKRQIDSFLNPKLSWKDVLPNVIMTHISRDDYTWKRFSRTYLAACNAILPSLYNQTRGKFVCAIDTSGSITQEDLTIYATEIKSLMQQVRPSEIVVVYCDAKVNHVDTFTNYDDLHFELHGGGGTRFSPVFDYVNENLEDVECLVYFTDMYCDDFGECGDYPVVWLSTTNGVRDVPFGTVVEYNDK